MPIKSILLPDNGRKRSVALAIALTAPFTAGAEDRSWLCIERASGGLTNDSAGGGWVGASFANSKSEIVVRPLTVEELADLDYKRDRAYLDFYGVVESDTGKITPCNIGFKFLERGELWQTPRAFCGVNSYTEFHFDRDTFRALRFEKAGYIDDTSTATPAIIGYTCSIMPAPESAN